MAREVDEQVLHDHIVTLLRREYYDYPSVAHPHLITFANHPLKNRGVKAADGTELFPDIVVFQGGSDTLVTVAEVETESTLDSAEVEEWRSFSNLNAKFYLYFPKGHGPAVALLCRGIAVTEFVEFHKEGGRYVLERYLPPSV